MPTQPNSQTPQPNVTFGQRVRNVWWDPNRSAWRNIGGIVGNVVRSGGNPIAAATQTIARAGMGEAREGIENAARRRGWDLNPFDNNRPQRTEAPQADRPSIPSRIAGWFGGGNRDNNPPPSRQPSAPPANPYNAADYGPTRESMTYNNNTDAASYGPTQRPFQPAFALPNGGQPVPRGVNRGNTTIAEGGAAEAMARGFAGTGLGASTYGRDLLMSTHREA